MSSLKIPILAVLGRKNSGKTTIAEHIVSELIKKGYRVAAAKHISIEGFSIDKEGKDTWRYSIAGANPVISVSDREVAIKMGRETDLFSLDWMLGVALKNGADVLLLEGFSSLILGDRMVGKIICVKNIEEYYEYKEKTGDDVLAYCSFKSLGEPIFETNRDLRIIVNRALEFVAEKQRVFSILRKLAGLNCGKCGRPSCLELAEAIHAGEASLEECVPLRLKSKLKTRILIDGKEVPIQLFVSEIIRKSVLGMISTLKGVNLSGEENLRIEISK